MFISMGLEYFSFSRSVGVVEKGPGSFLDEFLQVDGRYPSTIGHVSRTSRAELGFLWFCLFNLSVLQGPLAE